MLAAGMDHRYIDEHSVAERYVARILPLEDRAQFEAHLVDCQECTDRVLLAEMFDTKKPDSKKPEPVPLRAQLHMKPWQIVVILAVTVLLLAAVPALVIPLYLRLIR